MNIQFQPNHAHKNHFIEQMETNNMKTMPLNNVTKFKGKSRKSSSSNKFVGVRQRPSGRWVAEIKDTTQKIRMWLGTFETAEAAARAYDEAACLLRGSNTRTNFVVTHVSPNSPLASRIKNLLKRKKLESPKSNAINDNHVGDIKNNNPLALVPPSDTNNITIPPMNNTLGTTFPTSLNLSTNSPSAISTQLHASFEYRTLDNFCLQQENKMCTDALYRPQLSGFVGNYELVDHSSLVQCGMHQGGFEHNLNPPTLEMLPLIGLSQEVPQMLNSNVLAPQSIGSDLLEMQKIKMEDELPVSFDMASSSNGIYEYFDFLHDPSVDNLWDLPPFSSYFC